MTFLIIVYRLFKFSSYFPIDCIPKAVRFKTILWIFTDFNMVQSCCFISLWGISKECRILKPSFHCEKGFHIQSFRVIAKYRGRYEFFSFEILQGNVSCRRQTLLTNIHFLVKFRNSKCYNFFGITLISIKLRSITKFNSVFSVVL
jgi:hypothetical protein